MSTERRHAADGLFVLGLVGPAGSGKSTVARALVEDGARLLDADRIGHAVTEEDAVVRDALRAEYGADVYDPAGRLDRARVAAVVFRDRAARARLDALVHPRILERMRAQLEIWKREGFRGVVVVDAALMLDWGFERECDAVIAVSAPEDAALARLAASRGWSLEEGRARRAAQRAPNAFADAADAVLDNSRDPETLAREARRVVARLRDAAERRSTRL
jgi:dephospho-CoA kinase